jgi:hypothetical protein
VVEAPPPPPPQEIIVEAPPPPPRVVFERRPPPPVGWNDGEWIAGYQRWDGAHYVWEKGRWDHRPRPEARWQAAHWEGRAHGKVWVEGGWK